MVDRRGPGGVGVSEDRTGMGDVPGPAYPATRVYGNYGRPTAIADDSTVSIFASAVVVAGSAARYTIR